MTSKHKVYQIDDFTDYDCLGNNQRQISFIVFKKDHLDNPGLLEKIITAIGLDTEKDIAIFQLQDNDKRVILNDLNKHSQTKHFFLFGQESNHVSIQRTLQIHRPIVTENYILHPTYPLRALAEDVNKKKDLWTYLKKIFK